MSGCSPSYIFSQLVLRHPTCPSAAIGWVACVNRLCRGGKTLPLQFVPPFEICAAGAGSVCRRLADMEASQCAEHIWKAFGHAKVGAARVSWAGVARARDWLPSNNFLVSKFDQYTACLAAVCPRIGFAHAYKLRDFNFGPWASHGVNILWHEFGHFQRGSFLRSMAHPSSC